MNHFDAVERRFLRDPRVYRIFITTERFYFIYIGNIIRIDPQAIAALDGLEPDQMLSQNDLNYSLSRAEIGKHELFSSHFLLGHGLFWRFKTPEGKGRTFILHQWGDMTAAVAVLCWALGDALSKAKVDESMRPVLQQGEQRAARILITTEEPAHAENSTQAPMTVAAPAASPPTYQNWQHSRARLIQVVLFIAVLVSVLVRYTCR